MTDATDLERLLGEVVQLRAELVDAKSEIRILHGAAGGRLSGAGAFRRTVEVGSRERMAMLEHTVDVLDGFAGEVASWECYGCEPDSLCMPCRAQAAKDAVRAWRYGGSMDEPARRFVGAMYTRVDSGWNPRETKIHRSWVKHCEQHSGGADRMLGLILTDRSGSGLGMFESVDWPTPRDWYVATSVVQWLATNVGMGVLEDAGFKYTQWDEDTAAIDAKRAVQP